MGLLTGPNWDVWPREAMVAWVGLAAALSLSLSSYFLKTENNKEEKEKKGGARASVWAWGLFFRTHKNVLVPRK